MKIHLVKCDLCGVTEDLVWNGEHWCAPTTWISYWDDQRAETKGKHLCSFCNPLREKPKVNNPKGGDHVE